MRLWILSDIHLELTRGWDLPGLSERPDFDVLVVAGDLVPKAERGVAWLRARVDDRPVVYVMGNHEAYGVDIDRTLEKAKAAAAGSNVHVIQDETVLIDGVTFAGCCLWTDFALFGDQRRAMAIAGERMNDFKKIRIKKYVERFLPRHALARHRRSRAFLETELRRERTGPLVIVSHHAPMPDIGYRIAPLGPDETVSEDVMLASAYRSDLTALMVPAPDDGRGAQRPADIWVFGHADTTALRRSIAAFQFLMRLRDEAPTAYSKLREAPLSIVEVISKWTGVDKNRAFQLVDDWSKGVGTVRSLTKELKDARPKSYGGNTGYHLEKAYMAAAAPILERAVESAVGEEILLSAAEIKDAASGQNIDFVFKTRIGAEQLEQTIAALIVGPYTNKEMYQSRCSDWVAKAYALSWLYDFVVLALPDRDGFEIYRSRVAEFRVKLADRNASTRKPSVEVVWVDVPSLSKEEDDALEGLGGN